MEAFAYAQLDWAKYIKTSQRYFRPLEVDTLIADATKAREKLGWEPRVHFRELVAIMVDADMEAAGLTRPGKGKLILEEKLGYWNRWQQSVTKMVKAFEGSATQH